MVFALWELRNARQLTLRQLEEKSGVSKTQINAIENGKANPRVDTLELLAAALEVDITALFKV